MQDARAEQYAALVEEGRKLVRSNYALGELASEVETKYGEHSLEGYADEIGVSYSHLKACRTVEARLVRLEMASRDAFLPTWKVTETILKREDIAPDARRELLRQATAERWTVSKTYTKLGIATTTRWGQTERVQKVREALSDPAVARQVLADDDTALAAAKARHQYNQQRADRQDEAQRMRAPDLARSGDIAEAGNDMAHIASRLETLAQSLAKIPADDREGMRRTWDHIKQLVGWVDSIMANADMDAELVELLEGGQS